MTAAAQLLELEHDTDVDAGAASDASLFVDDVELRRRINPRVGLKRFRAAVRQAELRGFPQVKALWGGRYWPAVVKWLDKDNGVHNDEVVGDAEDGEETFGASEQRHTGAQAGSRPPGRHAAVVLDGAPGRAGHPRISGQVRGLASGR